MDRLILGMHLRALRHERGLALADVAGATDISTSFLSLVEGGKSDITITRLVRLADYFGVELADLVDASRTGEGTVEIFHRGDGNLIESPTEGVETRQLGRSSWTLAPSIDRYRPGGRVGIKDEPRGAQIRAREVFVYVMKGQFELSLAEREPVRLKDGEAALFRGTRRELENVGRSDGHLLVVSIPVLDSKDKPSK